MCVFIRTCENIVVVFVWEPEATTVAARAPATQATVCWSETMRYEDVYDKVIKCFMIFH